MLVGWRVSICQIPAEMAMLEEAEIFHWVVFADAGPEDCSGGLGAGGCDWDAGEGCEVVFEDFVSGGAGAEPKIGNTDRRVEDCGLGMAEIQPTRDTSIKMPESTRMIISRWKW